MTNNDVSFTLDSLAIQLAADGGHVWTDLADYPGYTRNIWRERARSLIERQMPGAVFEISPDEWDGSEGSYIVRTLAVAA